MVNGGLGPDMAAVAFYDPADAGQAEAGAGELGAVEALEGLEQLAGAGGIEADAVVGYEVGVRFAGGGGDTELDNGLGLAGGVLPGVAQKVIQDGADEAGVG